VLHVVPIVYAVCVIGVWDFKGRTSRESLPTTFKQEFYRPFQSIAYGEISCVGKHRHVFAEQHGVTLQKDIDV